MTTLHVKLALATAILGLGACATAPGADATDTNDDTFTSLGSVAFKSEMNLLGPIDPSGAESVDYTGEPRYVAVTFTATANEQIDAEVSGLPGGEVNQYLWVLDDSFAIVDKAKGTFDHPSATYSANIRTTITDAGSYYIVVRDVDQAAADLIVYLSTAP